MREFVLTPEEQRFAAEHHRLIYAFLNRERLPEEEFYGIAALGYLEAVHRQFEKPSPAFAFSTLASRIMRRRVSDAQRSSRRQAPAPVSLDTGGQNGAALYGSVPLPDAERFLELEERLLLHSFAAYLTPGQFDLVRLRLNGLTLREIAARHGISERTVRRRLRQIRSIFWTMYCSQSQAVHSRKTNQRGDS